MRLENRRSWCVRPVMAGILAAGLLPSARAEDAGVHLKDGRILRGRMGETSGLAEVSAGGEGDPLKQIIFVNDDFRITFVSRRQLESVGRDTALEDSVKFNCDQQHWEIGKNGRKKVASVGPPAGELKQFDEYGRRTYPMRMAHGVEKVVQVITEITPEYARVEALEYTWDMRIATSTIDDDTLEKLLMHQISPKNVDHRTKIIRFFIQCKRFRKASELLQKLLDEGIANTADTQELLKSRKAVRTLFAQQTLEELGLRRDKDQHALVQKYLDKFPSMFGKDDDVPGEILQTVRQVKQEYATIEVQRKTILAELDKLLLLVPEQSQRADLAAALRVIKDKLNVGTMPRMAAYLQNRDVQGIKPEELLSLAVGGWLLGADVATPNLPVSLSAWRMHRYVRDYLAEPMKIKRNRILPNIIKETAAQTAIVAALAAHMAPPYALPDLVDETTAGFYKVEVDVAPDQPSATYFVQLPPEYDPLRRYPMIVSLHAIGMDPEMQIDWWAGDKPDRRGQAGRNGYIVIAPAWTVEHQASYQGSPREHGVVLSCVRDACRRFAVDTDRVFLTGHSSGGDAAWDIGVSHPDLWAGVMPISAEALFSCKFYTDNARYVPFYVVLGELDGGRIARDAMVLDRYLKLGYNTTVVEYLGRGHEHFVDEMLPLLDWMGRCKRTFPLPRDREFTCQTMRPTDSNFWWAEVAQLPAGAAVVAWPPPKGTKPLLVHGNVPVNNNIVLTAGNLGATIWLSPDLVNFNARINISLGGRRPANVPAMIKPSVETVLEDLRVRGDRQHPFWAKVEAK